uniref:Uncharacterized protein n=1 Tax=Setaria italica TaxID=4555 RepID=K3YLV9_SETIT
MHAVLKWIGGSVVGWLEINLSFVDKDSWDSCDMPPEHGMPTGTADAVANRRPRRLFGRPSERKNPLNLQFERQVARLESRQQQQRCIVVTFIPINLCCFDFKSPSLTENGNNHPSSQPISPEDTSSLSPTSPSILFLPYPPDGSHRRWPGNSSRLLEDRSTTSNSTSNSDFLVNSFTKPSGNARHTSRRKSKKKSKKHRQRCRKPTDGPEAKCGETNSAAPAVDEGDCEDLTLSPKHVGDIHFEETFSPSSSVKEASEEAPESDNDNEYRCCSVGSVSSASYCDETEPSRSAISCPGLRGQCNSSNLRYLDSAQNSVFTGSAQETCYAGSSVNCNHDTKTLLILSNEREPGPCEATEFCSSSSGFDENWLEKPDYDSGICSQNGIGACSGVQAVHLCSDTSRDNDFCLVISRKRARKEKKMLLWKSYGERVSTFTHDRNEKYVGRASVPVTKEVRTDHRSHRQNHIGGIQPQHGTAIKHPSKNFMQRPSSVRMETHNGLPAEDSKLQASPNYFIGPREKTYEQSTSDFDKAQRLYLHGKLSVALHSRESIHCETGSVSSSETTTPKSSVPSVQGNHGCQQFCNSRTHLVEMLRVVNDAYKVQVAADVHLAAGYPITDLETFIYSATPVIGHAPCLRGSNCSWDEAVSSSVCQHDISNVSLRTIWEWFCVAWYPVYRVPRGNFRAAFLTYHSLGKLVPQKCSMDMTGGHPRVVSPVVGLQSYNAKGEQWFQLRCPDLKQLPTDEASCAEVQKERLRTLKMGALAMARAVVPKGSGESVNHHPDYEFFLSRCS